MASQSQVSAPSTTNSQPAAPSSNPGISRESFLQRARAAALRDKRASKSPASSRAQSPAGLHIASVQQAPQEATSGQSENHSPASAPDNAPRYGSILNAAPSWSTVESSSGAADTNQTPAAPAPAPISPTTGAMELDELQDLKADHDQRHSSPEIEFIQETGPTQQRQRPPLVSSASVPAPSSLTEQAATVPVPPSLFNFAQDSPSAAVDDELELPRTEAQWPEELNTTITTSDTAGQSSASVTAAASGAADAPNAADASTAAGGSSGSSDPSQPALFGDPSPLLPLIQSFPPDSRRIAIRSFETLPEDIRRKVLGSTAMMENFKAYVLTNVVPTQQQPTTTTTSQSDGGQQQSTTAPAPQPPATITQSTSIQPVEVAPLEPLPLTEEQKQSEQLQQAQLAQQQALQTATAHISNIGGQQQSLDSFAPAMQQPLSGQQGATLSNLSSAFATAQQQSPVIQQSPPTTFQQSPGVSHASTLQPQSPVVVQAAPQHYGPTVPAPFRQTPLDRSTATTTPGTTVSSALVSVGGMENRLGAWTQGLFQDVCQNLVAPLEAALRETERQRDQWKAVAENNSAALSQLLGQHANQQWQARLHTLTNEVNKARNEKNELNKLYRAALHTYGNQTNQLTAARTAYQELERKFNENRKHTLTIMTGFETLKRQNDELNRQKLAWQSNVAQSNGSAEAQAQVAALEQQIQQLQQERNAFALDSSNKGATVVELEKQVEELRRDREAAIKVMKTEAERWRQTAEKSAVLEEKARQADSRSAALEIRLRGVETNAQAKIAELERRLKESEGRPQADDGAQAKIADLERRLKESEGRPQADDGAQAKIADLERRLQQAERLAQADKAHAENKAQAERRAQLKAIDLEKQLKESESEVQDYKQQFESLRTTAQAKIDQQHATITKLRERNQRYKDVARQSIGAGSGSPALKRPSDSQASPSQSQRPRQ